MNGQTAQTPRRRGHFRLWLSLGFVVLSAMFLISVLSLTGRAIPAPGWMAQRLETRLNAALGPVQMTLGGINVTFTRHKLPQVHLRDVALSDAAGRPVAMLRDVRAAMSLRPFAERRVTLRRVALSGAELALTRAVDGRIDLTLGEEFAPEGAAASLPDVLRRIDALFASPALSGLEDLSVEDLTLSYADARAQRSWQIEGGLLTIEQTATDLSSRLFFSLTNDLGVPSEVALSFDLAKGSLLSRMSANFSNVPSADIAAQSPARTCLRVIDAPLSGALRSGVGAEGHLTPLSAALELGAGAIHPVAGAAPIPFRRGKSYFTYDPAAGKITMNETELDTAAVRLKAEGHAYLGDEVDGWPTSLVTQMQFREVALDPEGFFEQPARFNSGALDMKLALDPFTVTIGQVVLLDDAGTAYRGDGVIKARNDGWKLDLDFGVDQITRDRLIALWPVGLVPPTRRWVSENVFEGVLFNVEAALRIAPDHPVRLSLVHEFRDATVQFIKSMPPVHGGFGYVTMTEKTFTMVLDKGIVDAPGGGGPVDATGTVFHVPDITQRPARAEIDLKTESTVGAMLALLDHPVFNIMSRAGQPTDLAEGHARMEAKIGLSLAKKVTPQDVEYSVSGVLSDLRSEKAVPNRVLEADTLNLSADRDQISISGAARLDGVPVQGVWSQALGPEQQGQSRVEGTVELSPRFVKAFGIGLPDGTVTGSGLGHVAIDLAKDTAARFELTSDLNRVGLSLPGLGWSKPRIAHGSLQVSGSLGAPPVIDSLSISAPGLSAAGTLAIGGDGALREARFSRVRVGDWLDAPVVLGGRGPGRPPSVAIKGGRLDLRNSPFAKGRGTGEGGPVAVALDRLIVSRAITLYDVRGVLTPEGALNGRLRGRVGNGAPVVATLVPARGGTAIHVQSDDAGGVLRGAGIFEKSRGGTLDLMLTPRAAPGEYNGRMTIRNTRVKGAPVLAELLSAISVVGILQLLDGEGLTFSEVSADFILTPNALQISRGSAIGTSLGISLAGVYDLKANRVDMQGVISPIYLLNSVGSFLTRKGEGLFGFNYRLSGDAAAPSVGVNVLSILTPGMFREIFRRPPPEIAE